MSGPNDDDLVTSLLLASRALVAIAARSLDDLDDVDDGVTLPQFRALVVLATRGNLNLTALAEQVGVHTSSANRMCNRLVDRGLVDRATNPDSAREVTLGLTAGGRALIDTVMQRRRAEVARIVALMPAEDRAAAVRALQQFAVATGETPHQSWSYGWLV